LEKFPEHHNPVPSWNAGVVQEWGEAVGVLVLDVTATAD
jgi:hypothetical protein